jgi:hypothetical protein
MPRLHREPDVLLDRQPAEQVGDLEGTAQPRFGDGVRLHPAMERPSSVIRPASGANMPEIRLNAVVLPAPFGPISACSVRRRP